jgi:hypothetical protein
MDDRTCFMESAQIAKMATQTMIASCLDSITTGLSSAQLFYGR